MILYIDIEHPIISLDPHQGPERLKKLQEIAERFERIAGRPCRILHYTAFSPEHLRAGNPSALVLSGCSTLWHRYDLNTFAALFSVIRGEAAGGARDLPILGTCGGHQLIPLAFGAPVRPMRWLGQGEPDESTRERWLLESGFEKVHLRRRDPLFRRLPNPITVRESHYDEVVKLPPGFLWLAENATCRVQAMRHRSRPLYGVQFHPEHYDDDHPHGKTVLANFFALRPKVTLHTAPRQ